jgi:dethiobiotin synthetase
MNNKHFIITGIGTDIGKTVVSAILAQALDAYYWKPVQAGELGNSDSIKIREWTNDKVKVLPEAFRLTEAMSPHAAAEFDRVSISEVNLKLPEVKGNLIIEGAGGLMVPLNNEGLLLIDVFKSWNCPVILVSRHYLGSINHTLLTVEALKNRKIEIAGIVFVGDENVPSESVISKITKLRILARIPFAEKITADFILEQSEKIKNSFIFSTNLI